MLKYSLLTILLHIGSSYVEAQSRQDSLGNKIVDKFASAMSKDCALPDSVSEGLSNFIYEYLNEIRKMRRENPDQLIYAQKRIELSTAFESGLKERFGNCVYKNYKKIGSRYPDRTPNRNPERAKQRRPVVIME